MNSVTASLQQMHTLHFTIVKQDRTLGNYYSSGAHKHDHFKGYSPSLPKLCRGYM